MPSPVTPSQIKSSIPSNTGNFCEKYVDSYQLGKQVHDLVAYFFNEDGTISEAFETDLCALECLGGDGSNGDGDGTTFGRPTNLSASDGAFNDFVRLTWTGVAGATEYDVYRSLVNDTSTATLITSTNQTTYDDASAEDGVTYYYWVKARNASQISAFSVADTGYTPLSMDAISDLEASKGFAPFNAPYVALVFTAVPGATHYDFYIGDADDFSAAMLLDSDRTPFDNQGTSLTGPPATSKPLFINNQTDLVYHWNPTTVPDTYETKYFWVVAKVKDGAQVVSQSPESNSSAGWAVGFGQNVFVSTGTIGSGQTETVPGGSVKVWFAIHGAGGGGAGGDGDDGAGGGGGGAMVVGWFPVVAGSKFRLIDTPSTETGRAAASTNGSAGAATKLQYSANGLFSDTVDIVDIAAAGGGQFTNGGLGVGGTGAVVSSVHASVQDGDSWNGNDGLPAKAAGVGGSGGHRFGYYRARNAQGVGFVGDGGSLGAGGGANKNAALPAQAQGGSGALSFAFITYRAS